MFHLLFSATLLLAGGPSGAETTLLGRYILPSEDKVYGGLSAVHIGAQGSAFTAVSDRGSIIIGTIVRDAAGLITDIRVDDPIPLNTQDAGGYDGINDAEGVAVAADGTLYVSFEGEHRIGQFATPSAQEILVPRSPEFNAFTGNSGLEALAIDATGALYAIPETTSLPAEPYPVFRFQDGRWDQPFAIPSTDGYLVVGADFGPGGQLYVLERNFSTIGFFTRVRRIDRDAGTATVILETGLGVHGNMEGISVWENPAGETIMTLIADDNYRRILSNEIAEYRIDG